MYFDQKSGLGLRHGPDFLIAMAYKIFAVRGMHVMAEIL